MSDANDVAIVNEKKSLMVKAANEEVSYIVDERALAVMETRLAEMETELDRQKTHLAQFPDPHPRRRSIKLRLWWKYARRRNEYDKLYQSLALVRMRKRNIFAARQPTVIKPQSKDPDDEAHIPTRFDLLPDLCIIAISENLTTLADLRTLFAIIPDPCSVSRAFSQRVRGVYTDRGFMGESFKDCSLSSGWCRFPATCPRCFLYCKGRCIVCTHDSALNPDEHHNVLLCDNVVMTETTGLEIKCRDIINCPSCRFPYHPDEAEDVVRIRDFDCLKHNTRVGCIKCTTECDWCANIGCTHTHHYKVNPDVYLPTKDWERCEACEHPHCCAVFFIYEGVIDGGNNRPVMEWDQLVCPVWDPISPGSRPPPRRVLRGRRTAIHTCPSTADSAPCPVDCTSHSESRSAAP